VADWGWSIRASLAKAARVVQSVTFVKPLRYTVTEFLPLETSGVGMKTSVFFLGIALAVSALASGCETVVQSGLPDPKLSERDKQMMALAEPDEWRIPNTRSLVDYHTGERPGTIIVDTGPRYLYFVLPNNRAMRYRVATGVEAYAWTGRASVGQMKEWPTWMPTAAIMERWPEFRAYIAHGPLEGRWDNPLGARALYLFQGNQDTLYRIHGTNEPSEIGQAVSSGCIRMRDMDVIDLYGRVHIGTPVVVQ
jgi:lipoprotein-anchoring transpeptidase ErfK/SrfK